MRSEGDSGCKDRASPHTRDEGARRGGWSSTDWKFQRGLPSGSDTSEQPATREEATEGVAGRQSRKIRGTAEADRLRRPSRRSQGRSEPRAQQSLVLMCAPWEKHGPSDSGITADGGVERACRTRPAPLWRHDPAPESGGDRGTKELDHTWTPDPAASFPTHHHPTAEAK